MGYEMGLLLTASLAFLSLSSALALFNVLRSTPNMDLPRLRSPPPSAEAMSNRGRFLACGTGTGGDASSVGVGDRIRAS